MGVIVDLILIAILLAFMVIGYIRGLAGSLIKLASFAIAIVLAVTLYKPISNTLIEKTQIDEKIESTLIQNFSKEENPDKEKMPETLAESINSQIDKATTETRNDIVEKTAQSTTLTIIRAGTAIAIYIIARLLLLIVSIFAKGITKLPILKQIDKTGGVIYGILQGAVIVYILLGIVSLISVIWGSNPVVNAVSNSYFGAIIYNNNIILKLIFK